MNPNPNIHKECQDLEEEIMDAFRTMDKDFPEHIYHYTDPGGLLGIIESQELWFSQLGALNDSTEITHTVNLIRDTFEAALATARTPSARTFIERALSNVIARTKEGIPWFVACFCEKGDLLSQWRGYGSTGGGFSIGFHTNALEACATESESNCALLRVEYDLKKQRSHIHQAISNFVDLIESWVDAGWEPETNTLLDPALDSLGTILLMACIRFKHPAFQEEDEWRLVIGRETNRKDLKFRPAGSRIVPYFKINMRTLRATGRGDLPLAKIFCGPALHPEIAKKSIMLRLAQEPGFKDVPVEASGVPFRV